MGTIHAPKSEQAMRKSLSMLLGSREKSIYVAALYDASIFLLECQLAGKSLQDANDFLIATAKSLNKTT